MKVLLCEPRRAVVRAFTASFIYDFPADLSVADSPAQGRTMLDAFFDVVLCSLDDPDMRKLLDSVGGTRVILYSSKLSSEEGILLALQLNGAASDHVFGVTSAKHPIIVYRPIVDMGGGHYIEDCVGRVKLYVETLQRLDNIDEVNWCLFSDLISAQCPNRCHISIKEARPTIVAC
jgi:hypothetical protein